MEHYSFCFEQILFFHFEFELKFELDFEMDYDSTDDQALLNMMTWHYQKAITVAITYGCYTDHNS
jgi:hypothetical protein